MYILTETLQKPKVSGKHIILMERLQLFPVLFLTRVFISGSLYLISILTEVLKSPCFKFKNSAPLGRFTLCFNYFRQG